MSLTDERYATPGIAVILSDLQNDTAKGTGPYYGEVARVGRERNILARVGELIAGARKCGVPIIFTRTARRKETQPRGIVGNTLARKNEFLDGQLSFLVEGTSGADLVDELDVRPEDFVITKLRRSGFYNTSLEIILRSFAVHTLFLGGVSTHMAVEANVRDASDRDFNTVVVEDCCAAWPESDHRHAVERVFPRIARVMSTAEALALMASTRGRG